MRTFQVHYRYNSKGTWWVYEATAIDHFEVVKEILTKNKKYQNTIQIGEVWEKILGNPDER